MLNMNMKLFLKSIFSTYQNHRNAFPIIVTISTMLLTLNMSIIFHVADDLQGIACTKFTGT